MSIMARSVSNFALSSMCGYQCTSSQWTSSKNKKYIKKYNPPQWKIIVFGDSKE